MHAVQGYYTFNKKNVDANTDTLRKGYQNMASFHDTKFNFSNNYYVLYLTLFMTRALGPQIGTN